MKSSSRNGATVRALVVHTTEGARTVGDLRAFFDRPSAGGSSHAAADSTGALADGAADGYVDHSRAAWTLRNGNPWSENLELCAFAGWTRAQWLAAPRLLEACAVWLARRSKARGIPLTKLNVAQLRAQRRGVIDHDDYTDATGDGTHWDVGENFPWDVVIPRAIRLAGGSPAQPTPTRRRKRTMHLTRDTTNGATYLVRPEGLTHLRTTEEVNVLAWLLDETRDPNAVFSHNRRFHDVLHGVLSRPAGTRPLQAGRGEQPATAPLPELPAPDETDDAPDAIQPPPGFSGFSSAAPDHG